MFAPLDQLRLEHILPEAGSLRVDGKPVVSTNDALKVKEFLLVFYGSSRDRRSKLVAECLNRYAEYFNPEDSGLVSMKGEIMCSPRALQILYIPCERNFVEFQQFYMDHSETGWMYPEQPCYDQDPVALKQLVLSQK